MTAGETKRRRVLVTGGGRGLGRALVEALAGAGHDVTFTYRSSGDAAAALAEELARAHPAASIETIAADLSDRAAVTELAERVADGGYYGFVHNAGQSYDALAAAMDEDRAAEVMQINYWSFTRLAGALTRPMLRAREGRIVAIGSVAALRGNVGNAAYAASKAALLGYVRTLTLEAARRGVTVNYLAPGFIDTDMMAPYESHRETMEKQIPLGRFAQPDEIAATATFLLSEPARYITGATIPVDGGLTAAMPLQR